LKGLTLIDGEVISPILTNLKISLTNSLISLGKLASAHRALAHGQITALMNLSSQQSTWVSPKPITRLSVGGRN
jgi:hypothetical protein